MLAILISKFPNIINVKMESPKSLYTLPLILQLLIIFKQTHLNLKMTTSFQLMNLRIRKQLAQVQQQPLDNILVSIKNEREIHFCLYGLQAPYHEGFFHGVLQLPQNYPFSAPKFKLLTNNGRFQVNKYVCTTFTSYHQQAWSSSWTIRTILTAILSFFLSQETGYGTLQQTANRRSILSAQSLTRNLDQAEFSQLFSQQLIKQGIQHPQLSPVPSPPLQINMSTITKSLNDQIVVSQQNIESSMLQQEGGDRVNVRHVNNYNTVIKLLYGVLFGVVVVVVGNSWG